MKTDQALSKWANCQTISWFMDTDISAPRLLIADDSPIERNALAHFLRKSGYLVIEAENGNTVLLHLKNMAVDLLVLDLNMPQGDGFAVLKYLQEHRRGLPVVLLSGMAVDDIQRKMHRLPEQELPPLMLKPIDPAQLLQILDLQLSGDMPEVPPRDANGDFPSS
jgi:CheY-like chemotaxis protein